MFADSMDLLSLTIWRLTCKANYAHARSSLRRSLVHLLRPFVPNPQYLLDLITKHHALLGGELALAFILRDPTYCPTHLDIFTSDFEFDAVCDAIIDEPSVRDTIEGHIYTNNPPMDAIRRLVACTLTIRTTRALTIYVHRSYTTSAAAPITRAPCTALSNFVTAYGFACSHPRLTFARRALLADLDFPHMPAVLHATLDHLLLHRFSLAVSPAAWLEYRRRDSTVSPRPSSDGSDADDGEEAEEGEGDDWSEDFEPEDAR